MKKKLLSLLLIAMMVMTLGGCVKKKTTVKILIEDYRNFEALSFPKGTVGRIVDDYLVIELSKDGEYDCAIETDDDRRCDIHISYKDGVAVVTSENMETLVVEFE